MKKIRAVKGTYDILPGEVELWQEIERVVRKWMELYGCSEIRTPIFEETGLFARSIGEDTDIVGKEMYTFTDMGDRSLTLRPEGTASVIRAFIEHSLDQKGLPQALWYMGPMFRQEKPQKGRQRQFHQFGVELIGSSAPEADVEVMMLFDDIAEELGLSERVFSLNSIGGGESRKRYSAALVSFLDSIEDSLCGDCRRRKKTNPLRVLDCKVPGCREALRSSSGLPRTTDYLTPGDMRYYETVKKLLDSHGVGYVEDPYLVRGLDYYTGTIFEMNCSRLGAQSAVMGGGRYDNLVRELGGRDVPAVGFACGMERLVLALRDTDWRRTGGRPLKVYVAVPDGSSKEAASRYMAEIRRQGAIAVTDLLGRSMKAQMKAASREGADYVLIVEPEDGVVSARDMKKSEQEKMSFGDFLALVKKKTANQE